MLASQAAMLGKSLAIFIARPHCRGDIVAFCKVSLGE